MQHKAEPLASRMRPRTLEEFAGQQHIVGEGTALRTAIESDALSSVILSGPPGTGKTTLSKIIAASTKANFVQINAVMSGVKDLKEACLEATRLREAFSQRTVIFIDEIHRFNKAQQDALLPFVEQGIVILIGATTENPYFEVNAALVSRSRVEMLRPLTQDDVVHIIRKALEDERGYAGRVRMEDAAIEHIARVGNGDARSALNALELAVRTVGAEKGIAGKDVATLYPSRTLRYDKSGEQHYDTISAFIKTLRGSDPDAALVWLFTLLESGETPRFLFRRMAILACEDIGNADPQALAVVMRAQQAFEFVGMPEGEYFLAQACVYLAQAPKSNAIARAIHSVKAAINGAQSLEVPMHLRNAPVRAMRDHGYGEGYLYPHDHPDGIVSSNYFPVGMNPLDLYLPSDRGMEAEIQKRIEDSKKIIRSQ